MNRLLSFCFWWTLVVLSASILKGEVIERSQRQLQLHVFQTAVLADH